jgi:flavodoxin
MKTCILYFSRTGNTKLMAQAIADSVKAPAFDIASSQPSVVENYELIIIGTPVEGSSPAKETKEFVERLPKGEGKKTILFCTYRIWKGSALKILQSELASKGYENVLNLSKKGMTPGKPADFSDILEEIKKAAV